MQQHFHVRVRVDPLEAALVMRHHQPAIHVDRQEQRLLRAEVVADLQDLHPILDRLHEPFQVLDPRGDQAVVQPVHVIRFAGQRHHPVFEVAGPQSVEQLVRRSQRRDDGEVGVVVQELSIEPGSARIARRVSRGGW